MMECSAFFIGLCEVRHSQPLAWLRSPALVAWPVNHTNDGMLGIFHWFVWGPTLPDSGLVEAARPGGVRLVVEGRKMVECFAFFSLFFALSPLLGIASCRLGCWQLASLAGARMRVALGVSQHLF